MSKMAQKDGKNPVTIEPLVLLSSFGHFHSYNFLSNLHAKFKVIMSFFQIWTYDAKLEIFNKKHHMSKFEKSL